MRHIKLLPVIFLLACAVDAWGAACDMKTSPINFGAYDVFSPSPADGVGYIYVTCDTANMPFTIRLDAGTYSGGVFVPRKMKNKRGVFYTDYGLYLDSARTQLWGDGSGNTFIQTGTSIAGTATFNIYGRVHGLQNVSPGEYSDSVAATLIW